MKRKGKLPFDPKAFLSKVNGGRTVSEYEKHQVVYRQGDPADSVFYIQTGEVKKVTVVSEQGKEAVVALLGTGDFFGEGCLAGQPLRLATVAALTKCVIAQIEKADVPARSKNTSLCRIVHRASFGPQHRVEEDLVDQLFNSSEKRLARVLLLLANSARKASPSRS